MKSASIIIQILLLSTTMVSHAYVVPISPYITYADFYIGCGMCTFGVAHAADAKQFVADGNKLIATVPDYPFCKPADTPQTWHCYNFDSPYKYCDANKLHCGQYFGEWGPSTTGPPQQG